MANENFDKISKSLKIISIRLLMGVQFLSPQIEFSKLNFFSTNFENFLHYFLNFLAFISNILDTFEALWHCDYFRHCFELSLGITLIFLCNFEFFQLQMWITANFVHHLHLYRRKSLKIANDCLSTCRFQGMNSKQFSRNEKTTFF